MLYRQMLLPVKHIRQGALFRHKRRRALSRLNFFADKAAGFICLNAFFAILVFAK